MHVSGNRAVRNPISVAMALGNPEGSFFFLCLGEERSLHAFFENLRHASLNVL